MRRRFFWLAALPLAVTVGCGSNGKPVAKTASAPSPTVIALDTQGTVFCTLIDKSLADRRNGIEQILQDTDELNAATAAIKSRLPDLSKFGTASKIGIPGTDDATTTIELDDAQQLCRTHGWVGNP